MVVQAIESRLNALPFVRTDPADSAILSVWDVRSTGDPTSDNQLGREYADSLVEHMIAAQAPGILFQVAKAQNRHQMSAIEVGFWHRIATLTGVGEFGEN